MVTRNTYSHAGDKKNFVAKKKRGNLRRLKWSQEGIIIE